MNLLEERPFIRIGFKPNHPNRPVSLKGWFHIREKSMNNLIGGLGVVSVKVCRYT